MFDNIDYENSIEELMMFYGLDMSLDLDNDNVDDLYDLLFNLTFYLDLDFTSQKDNLYYKKRKEIITLLKFLKECEGSELKIQGTITKPQSNSLKGTPSKITLTNTDWFSFVERWAMYTYHFSNYGDIERVSLSPLRGRSKYKNKNANRGELAEGIIGIMNSFINEKLKLNWNKTKLYSFAYDVMDVCNLIGEKNTTEKGYSKIVGQEKFKIVGNWIRAYKYTQRIDYQMSKK